MAWSEQIFRYCERGADPAFWAEPVNAATNLGFIAAGVVSAVHFSRLDGDARRQPEAILIALVFAIGLGSFLFHTFATSWAALADVIPIGVFMLVYFGYALRCFAGAGWPVVGLAVAGFVLALHAAAEITCRPAFMPVSNALGVPCFNGTIGYLPALGAMVIVGGWQHVTRHPAALHLLAAAVVFLVSMVFRTMDFEICARVVAYDTRIGTHFVWHLMNAVVLYILLRAALLHGRKIRAK